MTNSKQRLISAVTLSGKMTIAHYLMVFKPLLKLKNKYRLLIFLADLHALTTNKDQKLLLQLRKETLAFLYAFGFEEDHVFLQSSINGHSFLTYILGCFVSKGSLERMTQFKKRKQNLQNKDFISFGLLNYPLLMASDILLYDADVLVGDDQKQHLELTRHLAKSLNNKYHFDLFHLPEIIKQQNHQYRVRDLQNPTKKMSKSSQNQKGIIFLDDTEDQIIKKIAKCVTDSENKIAFDFEKKPGVSNLILLYSLCLEINVSEGEKRLQQQCDDYVQLKKVVTAEIIKILKPIQEKYFNYLENNHHEAKLKIGNASAQKIVDAKIDKIKATLGLKI